MKFFYLPANQMNYIKLTPRCCMVTPDKLIMEGNWFPIYPHSQLGIRYTGNRKMPVARRNKEGPQVMYKWRPLLYNIDRCRSYLTRHPWSPHFRKKWHEFHCKLLLLPGSALHSLWGYGLFFQIQCFSVLLNLPVFATFFITKGSMKDKY